MLVSFGLYFNADDYYVEIRHCGIYIACCLACVVYDKILCGSVGDDLNCVLHCIGFILFLKSR